jgi:very-short-patch-repair endonuclease
MTERLTPEQYRDAVAGRLPKPRPKPESPAAELEREKRRADAERLENAFLAAWRATFPDRREPLRQHQFSPSRKWRLDFAWPESNLAVEIHGGTWSGGAHVRGGGITRDAEKKRAAIALGWRVLEYTTDDMREPVVVVNEVAKIMDRLA